MILIFSRILEKVNVFQICLNYIHLFVLWVPLADILKQSLNTGICGFKSRDDRSLAADFSSDLDLTAQCKSGDDL